MRSVKLKGHSLTEFIKKVEEKKQDTYFKQVDEEDQFLYLKT
jgi:hypothetical protein